MLSLLICEAQTPAWEQKWCHGPFKSGRINSIMTLEMKRKVLTMFQNVNVNRPRGLFNPAIYGP